MLNICKTIGKNIFLPLTHPNPNYKLYLNHKIDTCPHLLSTCTHSHINGLLIAWHNNDVHQIVHTLQSNKHTMCYTLANAGNRHTQPQDNIIPKCLIQCTCTCMAQLRLDTLCILRSPIDSCAPIPAYPSNTI